MVRVLTAHHFASQDIQTCEDPVAVAAVPPDKLLIASADHVVEVRDLSKGGEAVSSFPTVDLVQHMAYCSTGNYVATLEGSPSGATGGQGCVARVYSRWDAAGAPASGNASGTASGPAQSQPMRARIAGCVTPSPAQDQDAVSLDMIELPVRGRGGATALACCQATGNVLVACHRILVFFRYIVRTHESSRTRYIDFEDTEVRVSLSFPPTQAFLREELAVCMGRHSLLVFRLHHAQSQAAGTGSPRQQEDRGEAEAGQQHGNSSSSSSSSSRHRPLNLNRILELEQEVNSGRRAWGSGVAELGVTLPVTVQLPAIAAERASRGHCSPGSGVVHHSNPFVSDPADVAANVFAGSGAGASSDFQVEALLRLQLAGDPQGGHGEEFGCLTLQPLYRREPAPSASPARAAKASSSRHQGQGSSRQSQSPSPSRRSGPGAWLRSRHRGQLCGVACLVATQQEGYLYHFPMDGSPPAAHPCVAVYPFTAPVSRVVLEPLALHALTDTGLETYTLRSAHRSLAALQGVCPPADDPICLIGLRPFLGARHLLASGPHLVLLATSESSSPPPAEGAGAAAASPWTLYSLRLPTPEVLFSDMVAVGESHRVASPSTYCHLLGEAHCVLASARHLSDRPGVTASPVAKVLDDSEEALQALYRESCAHLGDFHMMSDEAADRDLAARYYRMARMEPQRVLDRMAKHAQRLAQPADHGGGGHGRPQDDSVVDGQVLSAQLHRGQVHYLEAEVLEGRQGNSGEPLDDQGARQLTSQLLELLEKRQDGDEVDAVRLAGLVLRARLLREYAATRTLALLRAAAPPTGDARASVVLALLLLEVQVGGVAGATEVLAQLQTLPSAALLAELLRHWELLLDGQGQGQGLSELASVLMERRPACMAALLAQLVEAETVSLARILKIMLDHLSTQIGSSGSGGSVVSVVFQRFLETFFASFFAANAVDCHMDLATEEALKILVRSYLSDLQAPAGPAGPPGAARLEPLQQVLLDEERLPFLDAMPPFAADLGERLASPVKHAAPPALHGGDNKKLSLRKLQAVLCSSRLPRACVMEVLRFVRSQPKLYGNLSLQTLCLSVREAVAVLLDFCPQAVLRYAQDLFRTEDDWRHLLSGLDAKLKTHSQNQALRALYQQTMTDVLDHLAHSVDVDTLCRLLQLDVAGVDLDVVRAHLPHLHTCQRVAGANAVRNYIASTSAAFLSQLDH